MKGFLVVILAALWLAPAAVANHSLTELVSTGPAGGNGPAAALGFSISLDGSHAFFSTTESLVPEDTDSQTDIYQRIRGVTSLVSTGPAGGNGPFPATPLFSSPYSPARYQHPAMTPDGSHVLFVTRERLDSEDTDDQSDIYERAGNVTRLVSTGPAGGNGSYQPKGDVSISSDGSRIFFVTSEVLTQDDLNSAPDLYLRTNGATTTLVSQGPVAGGSFQELLLIGASLDGGRAVFETNRPLDPRDTDGSYDVYQWAGGAPEIVSIGPSGGKSDITTFEPSMTPDGRHIFWHTYGPLVPEDTNGNEDVYEHTGGTTRLVSVGVSNGGAYSQFASSDGARVFFETRDRLTADDTNDARDVYVRESGTTTRLISSGSGPDGAFFVTGSADGQRVFFVTRATLSAADTDGDFSIYEWNRGTITYALPWARFDGIALSVDGSRLFVSSIRPLLATDTDSGCVEAPDSRPQPGCSDVFERFAGQLTLISTGPAAANGPYTVCENFFGVSSAFRSCPIAPSADGRQVLFRTRERLTTDDTDDQWDVYQSSIARGRPKPHHHHDRSEFCRNGRRHRSLAKQRRRHGARGKGRNGFGRCASDD